jgi:hypothetical protein
MSPPACEGLQVLGGVAPAAALTNGYAKVAPETAGQASSIIDAAGSDNEFENESAVMVDAAFGGRSSGWARGRSPPIVSAASVMAMHVDDSLVANRKAAAGTVNAAPAPATPPPSLLPRTYVRERCATPPPGLPTLSPRSAAFGAAAVFTGQRLATWPPTEFAPTVLSAPAVPAAAWSSEGVLHPAGDWPAAKQYELWKEAQHAARQDQGTPIATGHSSRSRVGDSPVDPRSPAAAGSQGGMSDSDTAHAAAAGGTPLDLSACEQQSEDALPSGHTMANLWRNLALAVGGSGK